MTAFSYPDIMNLIDAADRLSRSSSNLEATVACTGIKSGMLVTVHVWDMRPYRLITHVSSSRHSYEEMLKTIVKHIPEVEECA